MASERSCSVTLSDGCVESQYHSFVTILDAGATIPNYIDAAVQLIVVWGAK